MVIRSCMKARGQILNLEGKGSDLVKARGQILNLELLKSRTSSLGHLKET